MRISCPPTISPCYYGVDTPTREELIASEESRVRPRLTPEEAKEFEEQLDSRKILRGAGVSPAKLQPLRNAKTAGGTTAPPDSRSGRSERSVEEIRRYLGADTLGYLSLESLRRAVEDTRGSFCTSCYTGVYPVDGAQGELEPRAVESEEAPFVEIQVMPNER